MEAGLLLVLLIGLTLLIGALHPGWILCICMAAALAAGIVIFKESQFEPSFLRKKGQKVGPSYWGLYSGAAAERHDIEQVIEPPVQGVIKPAGLPSGATY